MLRISLDLLGWIGIVSFDEDVKGGLPEEDENDDERNYEMDVAHPVVVLLEVDVRPIEEERRCKGTAQQEQ
jgi:hypothetical protein